MTACLRVHTIGQCTFDLGGRLITPASDRLFGVALILTVRRGVTITRDALGDLLWDEPFEERDPHVLRQLLYRLRQTGFPLRERSDGLLSVDTPRWAPTASSEFSIARYHEELEHLHPARFGWLPGYRTETASLRRWIDDERLRIHGGIRRALHTALTAAEAQSDWRRVEGYAGHLLALEPDNEDAVHALATSCALHGSRLAALEVLDRFRETTEQTGEWMTLAAARLRRRVESLAEPIDDYGRPLPPIVGREGLRTALQQLIRTMRTDAQSRVAIVSGVHGSGKSRLAAEVGMFARLAGARVCALPQVDAGARPLAAQLCSWLLDAPGASGATPDLLAELRDTVSRQPVCDRLPRTAVLADVLWAVADDAPLLIILDGPARADRQMLDGLLAALAAVRAPVLCVLIASPTVAGRVTTPTGLPLLRGELDALTDEESGQVVDAWAEFLSRFAQPSSEVRARMVSHAGGNPRFLEQWVRQWVSTGSVEQVPVAVLAGMEAVRGETRTRSDSPSAISLLLTRPQRATRPPMTADSTLGNRQFLSEATPLLAEGNEQSVERLQKQWDSSRPSKKDIRSTRRLIAALLSAYRWTDALQLTMDALDCDNSPDANASLLGLGAEAAVSAGRYALADQLSRRFVDEVELPDLCTPAVASYWGRFLRSSVLSCSGGTGIRFRKSLMRLAQRTDVSASTRVRAASFLAKSSDFVSQDWQDMVMLKTSISSLPAYSALHVAERADCLMCLGAFDEPKRRVLSLASATAIAASRVSDSRLSGTFLGNAGTAAVFAGDVDIATERLTRALQLAKRTRSPFEVSIAAHRLSRHEMNYGQARMGYRIGKAARIGDLRNAPAAMSLRAASASFALLCAVVGDHSLAAEQVDPNDDLRGFPVGSTARVVAEVVRLEIANANRLPIQPGDVQRACTMLADASGSRLFDNCTALLFGIVGSTLSDSEARALLGRYLSNRQKGRAQLAGKLKAVLADSGSL